MTALCQFCSSALLLPNTTTTWASSPQQQALYYYSHAWLTPGLPAVHQQYPFGAIFFTTDLSCKTVLYKTLRGENACHNNDDISQVMALNNCFSTLWSHLSTSYTLSFFLVLFVGHVVHEEICSLCIKHIYLVSKAQTVLLYSFLFLLWNKHRHAHALDDARI